MVDHDIVDQAVVLGFLGGHVVVAFSVALDGFDVLAGVLGQDLVDHLSGLQDFFSGNLDFRSLPLCPAQRLVDQDSSMRQGKTLALFAFSQND